MMNILILSLITISGFSQSSSGFNQSQSIELPEIIHYPIQVQKKEYNWKKQSLKAATFAIPGFFAGTHEALLNKYSDFKEVFPGAQDQYWNPDISWKNKHTRGWPNTWFPVFTDGRHLTAGIRSGGLVLCTGFVIIGERRPWWQYAIDLGLSTVTYGLTTNLTYDWIYD